MSEITDAARRIDQFLKDEAVQAAIAAMKKENYRLFLVADDAEARLMAQARALNLDQFETALRGLVDAGERETTEEERAARRPAAR